MGDQSFHRDVIYIGKDIAKGVVRDRLYLDLAKRYAVFTGNPNSELKIERESTGRPCVKGADIDLSVSHSGSILVVLFSQARCGIDLQFYDGSEHLKSAKRYFGLKGDWDEIQDEFYRRWTTREARGKYEGKGFFGAPPQIPEEVVTKELTANDLQLDGDYDNFCCTMISVSKKMPDVIMI